MAPYALHLTPYALRFPSTPQHLTPCASLLELNASHISQPCLMVCRGFATKRPEVLELEETLARASGVASKGYAGMGKVHRAGRDMKSAKH